MKQQKELVVEGDSYGVGDKEGCYEIKYTYSVPSMAVLMRALSLEQNLARPKSAIFGLYLKSNKMLLALMSL